MSMIVKKHIITDIYKKYAVIITYEISKVKIFDELPPLDEMTHGDIQTKLFNHFKGI